jgi:TonB family protein
MAKFIRNRAAAFAAFIAFGLSGAHAASDSEYRFTGERSFTAAEQRILKQYAKKIHSQVGSWQLEENLQAVPGPTVVRFKIAPSGRLESLEVLKSSGNKTIDMLAMKLIWKASPFPPLPNVRDFTRRFVIPVQFKRRPGLTMRHAGPDGANSRR